MVRRQSRGCPMPDDPAKNEACSETPVEKDAAQEVGGRQPQRPGQHGKYQPRPGERDAATLPSAEPEGHAGPEPSRGVLPTAQKPRLGSPPDEE